MKDNRCVEIGEKFKIPIITKSTFNNNAGTVISDIIEENTIKGIVKKEISRISIVSNGIIRNFNCINKILDIIKSEKIEVLELSITENKITIMLKDIVDNKIVEEIQKEII